MPKYPGWMKPILKSHSTRTWTPTREELSKRKLPEFVILRGSRYLETSLKYHLPNEYKKLIKIEEAIETYRPKGDIIPGDPVKLSKAYRARVILLRKILKEHPALRRRMLSRMVRRYLIDEPGTQITFEKRHTITDSTLYDLLTRLKLHPTDFLEVGAAFDSHGRDLPDDIAPVRESREFFGKKGIDMRFTAADIVPIEKPRQRRYLKEGITALQWDYRKRPLYTGTGIKQFDVIRMANVTRHQSRTELIQTIQVLRQSLKPNGVLVIKNDGDGLTDEKFYQKQFRRGRWILHEIST